MNGISKKKQLKRFGGHDVILKKLENVESANRSWFEEVCNLKSSPEKCVSKIL
jgi:hypothetical protein